MKDLLKDFTFKKALRQLSDGGVDSLLVNKTNFTKADIDALRKSKKNKAAILDAVTGIVRENPECIRILRIAYFFHKNRTALISLRAYLANKNIPVDWEQVSKGKSEAEQVLYLYLAHLDHVADYFIFQAFGPKPPTFGR